MAPQNCGDAWTRVISHMRGQFHCTATVEYAHRLALSHITCGRVSRIQLHGRRAVRLRQLFDVAERGVHEIARWRSVECQREFGDQIALLSLVWRDVGGQRVEAALR